MINIFLLKTLCQLSLYFVFVQLIADLMLMRLNHVGTIAICVFVMWISFCLRRRFRLWRAVPLLLLALLIPFGTIADLIIIVVPIFLFALSIAFKRAYLIDDDSLRSITRIYVIFAVIMGLITVFSGGIGAGYLLFSVVCAIALSRDVRHELVTLEDPVYRAVSLSIIMSMIVGAFLVASDIGRRVIDGFLYGLLSLYLALVGRIGIAPMPDVHVETVEEYYEELGGLLDGLLVRVEEGSAVIDVLSAISIVHVVTVLGIVAIVIAFGIWVLRKLFVAFGTKNEGMALERENISVALQDKKMPRDKLKGYRGGVRRYYRRFIKLISKKGGKITPSHTSKDMIGFSTKLLGDGGDDLRNVYIRARYSEDNITKSDADTARDALKRLKSCL